MAEQLWKGRFSKAVDSRVNDFNSSIRFDQRMIAQDMRGSGVHAAMLARQGIISEQDCTDILSGLASIADDLSSGALTIDPAAEDVHTFVEQTLTARIGDAGKRLHTGRSRNDQVALDIRLTLRDYSHTLQAYIVELIKVICKKAGENTTAVMPGYTHLQRAQPITFGHALMAYASMLLRDLQRFEDATARMDAQCPLGSGALAGTTYPLDRQFTAEKLGFALRPEAAQVLRQLQKLGITQTVMMTGDSDRTARAIAAQVGVDRCFAEVLPEDKAAFVRDAKAEGHTVVMIGDGINDSPALSATDIGIAIHSGAAIAREIADVTIRADSLEELVTLKAIANALQKRVGSNYRFVLSFNSALILLGALGILPPATSAMLHNLSTLGISLRSMTDLLEQKPSL